MNLIVHSKHRAEWNGRTLRCAVGRSGFTRNKREGDGATPVREFPLREVFYRADRIAEPRTGLPCRALTDSDGWCDDPADPSYNRLVSLPYPASHEVLMRSDGLYDLLVVLGYNDELVVAGRGSAIFLHVAAPDFTPTEGCVALALADLQAVVAAFRPGDEVRIVLENEG